VFDETKEAMESRTQLPTTTTLRVQRVHAGSPLPFTLDNNCIVINSLSSEVKFRLMYGLVVVAVDGNEINQDINKFRNLTDDNLDFQVSFSEHVVFLPFHGTISSSGTAFEKYGITVDRNTLCLTHVSDLARANGARIGLRIKKVRIGHSIYYSQYYHDIMPDRFTILVGSMNSAASKRTPWVGVVLEQHTDATLCLHSSVNKFVNKNNVTLEYIETTNTHLSMDATSVCGL